MTWGIWLIHVHLVGGIPTPLKIWVRQLGLLSPIWWESQKKSLKFHGSKPPTSHIFSDTPTSCSNVFLFRLFLHNPGAQIWIEILAAIEVLFPIIRLSCKASSGPKGNSISQETNGNHGFEHTSVDHLENRSVCWSTTFELIPNHFRTCPLYHVCAGSCAAFCG